MEIEWTETALDDMAGLDKGIARRVKQSVERFAETGAGIRRARSQASRNVETAFHRKDRARSASRRLQR